MKFLFDLLPVIFFFGAFKWANGHKEASAQWLTEHLGFMVSGGVVGATEAPTLVATVVVAAVSMLQIGILKALGKKVDKLLWVTLSIVLVLGSLTLWFHSETFIKWKPTLIYWVMSGGFLVAQVVMKRNVLRSMMGGQIDAPDAVWLKLGWAWAGFFALMGVLNLHVAFNYTTDQWVDFKTWGATSLVLVFTLAQGIYLSRHMLPVTDEAVEGGAAK